MVPTSDWARAVTENKRRLEIASTAKRQETLAALDLLDLGARLSVTVLTGFANRDMVERRAAIAGKIPILDIRGLSQTKDCSGAMLCAFATRFGRGLPGVYTGGFNGLTGSIWISTGMCTTTGELRRLYQTLTETSSLLFPGSVNLLRDEA
jgi:hypothetical protein